MSRTERKRPPVRIHQAFVFLLLAVFAGSAVMMTALGARVYRDTVEQSDRNNSRRILTSVIRGAAQGEDDGGVSVRTEAGIPVLVFTEEYDGEIYLRRLFCADGWLRESYSSQERSFEADMGEPLTEAVSFAPEIRDGLLSARITLPGGETEEVFVRLRAGGEQE